MRVSIVTYHTALPELEQILSCLESPVVTAIDIVDNGSEQRLRDFCQGRHNVVYQAAPNNGYGAGHNRSLRASLDAGERYHLVINSDMKFYPAVLQKMVRYMEEHPDIGLLHPRIVGPDGEDQWTVRALPTPFDLILRRFLPGWMCRKSRDRYLLKHIDHSLPFDAQYVQGSFMLLRMEALRDVGLFDERFFMYPEDIDLSRRIAERWRVTYYPYAVVEHDHRAASYESLRMTLIHITNILRYFRKWGLRR